MANKTFVKVDPKDVREYWICPDCKDKRPVYCHPDWYQDNGTLTCECGEDMKFDHVEVWATIMVD